MKRYLLAAAFTAASPALSCPDWQAVAKFDEMIAKRDGQILSSLNCADSDYMPSAMIRDLYKAGKKPPQKTETCSAYTDTYDGDYAKMAQHRDAAMSDNCGAGGHQP